MRRGQLIIAIVLVVALLALIAGIVAVRSLLSPQRFTTMLRDQANAAGLQMQLSGPARPAIWPHLAVHLKGLRLRRNGIGKPMLVADDAFLVVPWSGLLHGEARIGKLQINAPTIDVEQVQSWLANLDRNSTTPEKIELPTIEAGVHVVNATVLKGPALLLKSLDVDTGPLKSGQRFNLDLHGLDPDDRKLELRVEAVPVQDGDGIALDPLSLYLAAGAPPSLQMSGRMRWSGGLHLAGTLEGKLQLAQGSYTSSIKWQPAASGQSRVRVVLDGNATHMDLVLDPAQVWQWWRQISAARAGPLPVPPVRGAIRADELELGSLKIRGLQIESGLPSSASAPQPANAGTTAEP